MSTCFIWWNHFPFHKSSHHSTSINLQFLISSSFSTSSNSSLPSISSPIISSLSDHVPLHTNTSSNSSLPSQFTSNTLPLHNIHPMVTRTKNGIFKPKTYTVTKSHLPTLVEFVPITYNLTSTYSHWRLAMQDEFNAFQSTGTWTLVHSSSSQNVVSCK